MDDLTDPLFDGFLFLKKKGSYEKVAYKDIAILKVNGDYVNCILINESVFTLRISLHKMGEILSSSDFMRIHRSYLIQTLLIESINFQEDFVIIGKNQIPMNRVSKRILNQLITRLE